jgi:hypothetical protein
MVDNLLSPEDLRHIGDQVVNLEHGWEYVISRQWVDTQLILGLRMDTRHRAYVGVSSGGAVYAFDGEAGSLLRRANIVPDPVVLKIIWNELDQLLPGWMDEDIGEYA